jgi:hypothetical protein
MLGTGRGTRTVVLGIEFGTGRGTRKVVLDTGRGSLVIPHFVNGLGGEVA